MQTPGPLEELTGGKVNRGGSPLKLVEDVRKGFSFERSERTYKLLGFTLDQVAESVGIPKRTLHRRKQEGARLLPSESEKMLRLARVGAAAIDVLGSREKAKVWLRSPIPSLGGSTPASMLDTEVGTQAVLEVLTRIEHGVYS